MEIKLPKRQDGKDQTMVTNGNQITVIGANGAGKSRFCNKLLQGFGNRAYRMSALKGIHSETYHNLMPGSIESRYNELLKCNQMFESKANTEFERLVVLLMSDEFMELIGYKSSMLLGGNETPPPRTKLDTLVHVWQAIFPKNKILRDGARLLIKNDQDENPYSTLRLSDGEKAALYYIGAALYAPENALVMVDDPEIFIHPSLIQSLWNEIEEMRPDCTFVYSTHDVQFATSRIDNKCIWVKSFDVAHETWDYEFVNPSEELSDELYVDLLGSRKPILFIEGDSVHSIDSKLYTLVFKEYTVKPMGSCDKVIEATRSFNQLQSFHNLDSRGIVDRDRRDEGEVKYLRNKRIFVPNVAEVENILLLEGVIRAVARYRQCDEERVFARVKRNVEVRIDKRFEDITALEKHMIFLINEIKPREMYEDICERFKTFADTNNYDMVLRVFNEKTMLTQCGVAQLCGLKNKDEYIKTILNILKHNGREAKAIRQAVLHCFGLDEEGAPGNKKQ